MDTNTDLDAAHESQTEVFPAQEMNKVFKELNRTDMLV